MVSKTTLSYTSPGDPLLKRVVINSLERITGRPKLEQMYDELKAMNLPAIEVWGMALQQLSIETVFDQEKLQQIPAEGPLIFIANHPFGVVDGLILGYMLAQVRQKFVVLVNEVLCQTKLLSDFFLPIDFRDTREAMQINIQSRRETMDRMKQGEALAIFPAGGVSTSPKFWSKADDLEWKRFVIKMIKQTRATVIPLYIYGQNSRLFQVVSQFSPYLRLGLLIHEIRNKMGQKVYLEIGDPIPYEELSKWKDRQELLDHLRKVTYGLAKK